MQMLCVQAASIGLATSNCSLQTAVAVFSPLLTGNSQSCVPAMLFQCDFICSVRLQLYVGERPWAGLRPVQIILKKTTGRANLAFPPGTPAAYKVQLALTTILRCSTLQGCPGPVLTRSCAC